MFTCRIIFAAMLFALVPARAKIFAQSSFALTSESRYLDSNYHLAEVGIMDFLPIKKGIDSILNSLNLTRDEVEIFGGSSVKNSLIQSLNPSEKYDKKESVDLEKVFCYRKEGVSPGYSIDSIIV